MLSRRNLIINRNPATGIITSTAIPTCSGNWFLDQSMPSWPRDELDNSASYCSSDFYGPVFNRCRRFVPPRHHTGKPPVSLHRRRLSRHDERLYLVQGPKISPAFSKPNSLLLLRDIELRPSSVMRCPGGAKVTPMIKTMLGCRNLGRTGETA